MKYKNTVTGETISSYDYNSLPINTQKDYVRIDEDENDNQPSTTGNSDLLSDVVMLGALLVDDTPNVDTPSIPDSPAGLDSYGGGDFGGGGAGDSW